MRKRTLKYLSFLLVFIGFFFLTNPQLNITGAVIGSSALSSAISLILGLVFIIGGIVVMASKKNLESIIKIPLEGKAKINYAIDNSTLKRITEDTLTSNQILKVLNRKLDYLAKTGEMGSFDKSFKYVDDTDRKYFYLRDISSGARIFLKYLGDNEYDLVGISKGTQKKDEEKNMIEKIKEIYQKELNNKK